MFEPKQNVRIKNLTAHNQDPDRQVYALVVRMMAGGEYVILNIGDTFDVRAKVEDVEPF